MQFRLDALPELTSSRVASILLSLRNTYAHGAAASKKSAYQTAWGEVNRAHSTVSEAIDAWELQEMFGDATVRSRRRWGAASDSPLRLGDISFEARPQAGAGARLRW